MRLMDRQRSKMTCWAPKDLILSRLFKTGAGVVPDKGQFSIFVLFVLMKCLKSPLMYCSNFTKTSRSTVSGERSKREGCNFALE